jgi:thioredoxin reductase (NADPH)
MEEAIFLTKFARSVTLIHRREEFRASKIMLDRALANEKITFLTNTAITEIEGDPKVTGIRLQDTVTGEESKLAVTGVFVAIGHIPRSDLVRGQVGVDEDGYVQVQGRTTATSLEGVFAAGDLVDHTYRQAITAAGTGCSAALDAQHYLATQGAPDVVTDPIAASTDVPVTAADRSSEPVLDPVR